MPYIPQNQRNHLAGNPKPKHPGQLNYLITKLLYLYLRVRGTSYQSINDIIGVLDCAKMEFYTRVAIPYENEKRKLNGEVTEEE